MGMCGQVVEDLGFFGRGRFRNLVSYFFFLVFMVTKQGSKLSGARVGCTVFVDIIVCSVLKLHQ